MKELISWHLLKLKTFAFTVKRAKENVTCLEKIFLNDTSDKNLSKIYDE
jgi:hypothetical protein